MPTGRPRLEVQKVYYTLDEVAKLAKIKPSQVRYIIGLLHIPYRVERKGTLKLHAKEVKRYFY